MKLERRQGVPITIRKVHNTGYDCYHVEGFFYTDTYMKKQYPLSGIYFSVYQPTGSGNYLSWGCGVQGHFGTFGYWLQYPEIWDDPEFVTVFKKTFHGWGTFVGCVTDRQLDNYEGAGRRFLEKMGKHFMVHLAGHFPNYTHGPNNMNIVAVNFSQDPSKPVSWARKNTHETLVPPVQMELADVPPAPAPVSRTYLRDKLGRFIGRKATVQV